MKCNGHQYTFHPKISPQGSFHPKSYSPQVAERILEACSGFTIIYAKHQKLKPSRLIRAIREGLSEETPQNPPPFTTDFEIDIDSNFNRHKFPVVAYYQQRPEIFDWCHVSIDLAQNQHDSVICIEPLRKRVGITAMDISEKFLELASQVVGIGYSQYSDTGYTQHQRESLFHRVFPPLGEASIPRVYKQNVIDFIKFGERKRVRRGFSPRVLKPENQTKAMDLIDKAFEAYQLEAIVMDILKIKKEPRSNYIWSEKMREYDRWKRSQPLEDEA